MVMTRLEENHFSQRASRAGRWPNARDALRALCWLTLFITASGAYGAEAKPDKRVLIISTGSRFSPGFTLVDKALLESLAKMPSGSIETYGENLDILRFPSERFARIFSDYLTEKYANPPRTSSSSFT